MRYIAAGCNAYIPVDECKKPGEQVPHSDPQILQLAGAQAAIAQDLVAHCHLLWDSYLMDTPALDACV
jgi:hypothetical protein